MMVALRTFAVIVALVIAMFAIYPQTRWVAAELGFIVLLGAALTAWIILLDYAVSELP